MNENMWIKFEGEMVDVLLKLDPERYGTDRTRAVKAIFTEPCDPRSFSISCSRDN